jgi:hypothetical protein
MHYARAYSFLVANDEIISLQVQSGASRPLLPFICQQSFTFPFMIE